MLRRRLLLQLKCLGGGGGEGRSWKEGGGEDCMPLNECRKLGRPVSAQFAFKKDTPLVITC